MSNTTGLRGTPPKATVGESSYLSDQSPGMEPSLEDVDVVMWSWRMKSDPHLSASLSALIDHVGLRSTRVRSDSKAFGRAFSSDDAP